MPATIKSKRDANIVKSNFLANIPTLEITPTLKEEECAICKEPYQNNVWEQGGTVHRPVALPCGHVFGFQCLARWMLSPKFDNHCSLCRMSIVEPLPAREQLSLALASSVARLETIAIFTNNGHSQSQQSQLLEACELLLGPERALRVTTQDHDRFLVVMEEFEDMLGLDLASPEGQNLEPLAGRAVAGPAGEDQFVAPNWYEYQEMRKLFLVIEEHHRENSDILAALLVTCLAHMMWDVYAGGWETLIPSSSALLDCLAIYLIGVIVLVIDLNWEFEFGGRRIFHGVMLFVCALEVVVLMSRWCFWD